MIRSNKIMLFILVCAIVLAGSAVVRADVIGYWKYDGSLSDSSGGGFTGTYTGGSGPNYVAGKLGQAMDYTSSERVQVADHAVWDTGSAVSVSHWFNTTTVQGGVGFLVHDRSNYKYLTYLTSNSKNLTFYTRTTDGVVKSAGYSLPTGNWADGNWHHYVGVYDRYASDGNRIKLYVDGALVGTHVGVDLDLGSGDEGIRMGQGWSTGYTGLLDDVAVFDHPLSAAEIAYLYNGGAGNTVNANVYWSDTSGNWGDPTKWNPQREPYSCDTVYVQNGGTVTIDGDVACNGVRIGFNAGTTGTVEMTGGSLSQKSATETFYVGYNGHGEFRQSGGDVSMNRSIHIGARPTGSGLYEISGSGVLNVGTTTYLGTGGGHGEIVQSGGTVNLPADLYMAVWSSGSHGIYTISDGILNAAKIQVGHGGTGEFYQSGGQANLSGALQLAYGYGGTGSGLYEISGGQLDVDGELAVGHHASRPAEFKIIGDAATINVGGYSQNGVSTLDLDFTAGGISTINVDGSVELAGTLDMDLAALAGTSHQSFTLISNDGTDPIVGTFAGVPEGTRFDVPGFGYLWLSYTGGPGGNDLVLGVPEPASTILLGLGALCLVGYRRRRK